jgi:hypothetical protein
MDKGAPFQVRETCLHLHSLTCGIDLVCTGCGLVLETNPFDDGPEWCASGPREIPREEPSSRRFRAELASVARELGVPAEWRMLDSLAGGQRRPEGLFRYGAVARLYSHLRSELPLEYVLDCLGISLHAVAPALIAEGVYEDEPRETMIGFGLRRTSAPPEARRDCVRLLDEFPSCSRRHLVAAALAEWVGEDVSAHAFRLAPQALRAYQTSLTARRAAKLTQD